MSDILRADIDRFSQRLQSARRAAAEQQRDTARPAPEVDNALKQLEEAWEELSVAEEELRQQSDEVAASRSALEAERQRYLSLFEFAPDAYLVTDASGAIREANQAALALLDRPRTSVIGKPLPLFVPTERRRELRLAIARLRENRRARDWDVVFERRQRGNFAGAVRVAVMPAPGGGVELRWMIRDVTDRLRMEEELEHRVAQRTADLQTANREKEEALEREYGLRQRAEQSDRAKDAFLAMLSHELRTPMTALVGWVHLLVHGRLNEETHRRALEAVERSTKAQVKLINDMLDVSRIITGKLQLEACRVDLASIVGTAVSVLLPNAADKDLTIRYESGVEHAWLQGDPERLQQVVWNLLSNAMKFTPAGGAIDVRLTRDGQRVTVSVTDTGIGIAPEFVPQVFERFRQADESSTRSQGGLGLGLAIARHLVERHGGEIRAESAGLGRGATFSFWLPLVSDIREASAEALQPAFENRPVRVLVVEDDADTREMLAVALEMLGVQLIAVSSAQEALERLPEVRPDVIVSDIGMPGEDGFSLIEQVRRLPAAEGGQTPAVALSGYLLQETRRRALASGFQVLVTKPVVPEQLVTVVHELARRSPRQS
jgi:PAS domain S-box-containing protein